MSQSQKKSARNQNITKLKIVESAEKLFWHQGHKATSLDEIAKDAGQSKGAFFHYFKSKGDVTRLVLQKYAQEELFAPLEREFAGADDLKPALLGWATYMYEAYTKNQYQGGCLLGNMALELADQDEDLRGEMAAIFLEWENRLVGFIREYAEPEELRMQDRQFARILMACLQGITMSIKVHKDKNRAAREFRAMGEMIEELFRD